MGIRRSGILIIRPISIVAFFVFVVAGCTSREPNIFMPNDFYSNVNGKQLTLVAINETPTANASFPGAKCLLCTGAAKLTNISLSKHAKTLSTSSLDDLSERIAIGLERKSLNAQHIPEKNDFKELKVFPVFSAQEKFAKKDFRPLKEKLGADRLVLLTILGVGVRKPYVDYIPTGEPVAFLHLNVKMVNLQNNELIVNTVVYSAVPADGEWKEPPFYPGLTTAFHQAISDAEYKIGEVLRIEL
jgi:hypothetical protein